MLEALPKVVRLKPLNSGSGGVGPAGASSGACLSWGGAVVDGRCLSSLAAVGRPRDGCNRKEGWLPYIAHVN